jgi:hypothetical protein
MAAHVKIGTDLPEGIVPVRRMGASSRGAFELLRVGLVLIPVGAGLDKFSNFLCDWTKYLSPFVLDLSPMSASSLLYLVGFIEVFCGFLVIAAPRIGALALAGWLGLVVVNLALLGEYWDVALRDVGLILGALALAQLSRAHEEVEFSVPRRRVRRREVVTRMPRTDTLTSPSEP